MKIRLAVLMSDERYLSSFADLFLMRYAEHIELSVFTQVKDSVGVIQKNRPDLILVEQALLEEPLDDFANSRIVCFAEEKGVSMWRGYPAVCKYQKISAIFKCIADLYAEKMEEEAVKLKGDLRNKKVLTFFSGSGGVGASTAAAACACFLAEQGERVLYLNLEQTGVADQFFSAQGEEDFGKVLYALEMSAASPAVRMENALRKDARGVYFYAGCASALDMAQLDAEWMERLFEQLGVIDLFDWIVVDMDFSLGTSIYEQIGRSYMTVFVSDGSVMANAKLERKLQALEIMAQQQEQILLSRIFLLYNRFGSRDSKKIEGSAFKEIGGICRFADAGTQDLLRLMAQNEVFQEMLSESLSYGTRTAHAAERRLT